MNKSAFAWRLSKFAIAMALFMATALPAAHAATIWNGPTVTWTKSGATPSDTILPGKVVLRRGGSGPLYNTALSETSARPGSPKGIEFAFGDLSNFASLSYQSMDSMRNGNLAAKILNKPMVAHIIDGDIYFSIKFTVWGTHGAGTVSYVRSTAAQVEPPNVTLTSPTDGASFTAPATVNLSATAGGGTITGVSFYNGDTLLGTVATAPYNFSANDLPAGSYSFTAVATTAESAATSGVVHVTVTAPVTSVTLDPPSLIDGNFAFNFPTAPSQNYVIEAASSISPTGTLNWVPVTTNNAAGASASFSEAVSSGGVLRLFRVGQLTGQ